MQYANTLLRDKVLFGSDFPAITPDRWIRDFENLEIKPGGAAADHEGERGQAAAAWR